MAIFEIIVIIAFVAVLAFALEIVIVIYLDKIGGNNMSEQLYKRKIIEKDGNTVEAYEPFTPITHPAQPKPSSISVEELGAWLEGALSVGSTGESIAVDMLARYEVIAK